MTIYVLSCKVQMLKLVNMGATAKSQPTCAGHLVFILKVCRATDPPSSYVLAAPECRACLPLPFIPHS